MDPLTNPYTPNAGAQPTTLAGRNPQLDSFDLLLARLMRGRPQQSMIVTGLRGVGKTVLLGQFRKKALAANWVVAELEIRKHDDTEFRRMMASRMRTALLEISPKAALRS
ncbi:ATP-binding protein [Gordonia alkaliphila]|uniref:Orc1-like AAA ATPase domain-containing protein n=1 Tax=Gordonia alkaliphila TaxID=1053547 RepID=A0ABP8ZKB6_9ACTN